VMNELYTTESASEMDAVTNESRCTASSRVGATAASLEICAMPNEAHTTATMESSSNLEI
jgi:hypothetical protein